MKVKRMLTYLEYEVWLTTDIADLPSRTRRGEINVGLLIQPEEPHLEAQYRLYEVHLQHRQVVVFGMHTEKLEKLKKA